MLLATADDATDAGVRLVGDMLSGDYPQLTQATAMTFDAALEQENLEYPLVSPFRPTRDQATWLVVLTSLFVEPEGPPMSDTRPARRPACMDAIAILDAQTGNELLLTLRPSLLCH